MDYLGPVMWGPDGNPLSEEEAAFLQEHLGRQDSDNSPPGSDPEVPNPYFSLGLLWLISY